ncbi:hypothetical protein CEXT_121791 [Caerostris extrusa]|uniref:Uncharacterized protein n=1 Tax=Caerostris extrusa TaxID=172846 RepID=A0AAV4QYZ6_CAEEX|nr:hypothetical protein CEXT_121791 [Caerostris extrusa]
MKRNFLVGRRQRDNVSLEKTWNVTKEQFSKSTIWDSSESSPKETSKKFQLSISRISIQTAIPNEKKMFLRGRRPRDNVSLEKTSNVDKEQFSKSTISGLFRVEGAEERQCVIGEDIERQKEQFSKSTIWGLIRVEVVPKIWEHCDPLPE